MAINDTRGANYKRPRGNRMDATRTTKAGLPAESLGAVIGAIVGSAATALLKTRKGQKVNHGAAVEAGVKTAGAVMVGQMGLLASEAVGSAMNVVKNAQAKTDEWLARSGAQDTFSNRDRIAGEDEESRQSEVSHEHGP